MEEDDRKKQTPESDIKVKKNKSLFYRLAITVIFLSSLSMCIYQTQELVLFFLSDPIETQIKVTVNDVVKFPAITICNLNPVRKIQVRFRPIASNLGSDSCRWVVSALARENSTTGIRTCSRLILANHCCPECLRVLPLMIQIFWHSTEWNDIGLQNFNMASKF